MSFLRFIARSLVASAFIADGVQKLTRPDDSAAEAEAFTSAVTPLVQRVVPSSYSSWVPEDSSTWIRWAGGAEVLGGAMFATGIGRRLGALVLAKVSILNVAIAWPGKDSSKEARQAARPQILTGVALLGSTLLAAQDTQGRPSLKWRAAQGIDQTGRKLASEKDDLTRRTKKKVKKAGRKAKREARKLGRKLDQAVSA